MPCTFVFVLNVRPSSFGQANSSERTMIVLLPVMTLLFRALVIRHRVVDLTSADQKQLYASSVCRCLITVVLSAYFEQDGDLRQSTPSFASDAPPQYIVLALLVAQVIAQTVVRVKATEESIIDNTDWPWSSTTSQMSSAVLSFDELPRRLVMGSIKRSLLIVTKAVAKGFILNYVALSQMAMVVAGFASSGATSSSTIDQSSLVIGIIPVISLGAMLLHNTAKLIRLLWQRSCRKTELAASRRSDRDSFY